MRSMSGQTILITGASRGIGAATARTALAAGARIVGSYRRAPGALSGLAVEFGEERVDALQADLAQPGAGRDLWQRALERCGVLHGLVNNAGIAVSTPLEADDVAWDRGWRDVLAVNTLAVADLCRSAIRSFRGQGGGRITTVASRAAFRGDKADHLHYAASKGAVVAMMRSIARACAADGVMAFVVAPGWVRTDMASVLDQPGYEDALDEIPMGEAAPPEEVANMIVFLMAGMADHATGSTFDINGASYVR